MDDKLISRRDLRKMLAEGVPHAVEALIELVKFGKDRERLAAAKESSDL